MSNTKNTDKNTASEGQKTIALNKSARHEYHLESRYEAGISLQGWELKAIRAGRLNMGESYAVVKGGEILWFGAQITPLLQASTHVIADCPPDPQTVAAPQRNRQAGRQGGTRRLHPDSDRLLLERQ